MAGIDVVAHEKAACASLVARGQVLLIARYQGTLFGFPAGVARRPLPRCFLAVRGYEGEGSGRPRPACASAWGDLLPPGVVGNRLNSRQLLVAVVCFVQTRSKASR